MSPTREYLYEKGFLFSAILSGSIVFLIFAFMLIMGLPLFKGNQVVALIKNDWLPARGVYGIYPMVVATLAISFFSLALAFPLSLGCAFFSGSIAPPRIARVFRKMIQIMTGIPTVIYGFVGIFLLVPIVREFTTSTSGLCIFSASLMLGIMISPTLILFFTDSLEAVQKSFLDAADALGATRVQKLLYVMVPQAKKGILAGLILALGRALGDTMVALMIAGNAARVPESLFDAARTLTAHIALVIAADYESFEFRSIFACGLVLYAFIALMVLGVRWIGMTNKR